MADNCDCPQKNDGGMGCVGVVIVVLIVLWLTGYWNRQPEVITTPTTTTGAKQP